MAIFRKLHTAFWQDAKVIEELTPEDKFFFIYLLTNPATTQIGIYQITKKQMSFELGYSIESINSLMDRFENHHKLIKYNPYTREIALKNWGKYNLDRSGKPMLDCVKKELEEVSDISLIEYVSKGIKKEDIKDIFKSYLNKENINKSNNDTYNESYTDTFKNLGQEEEEDKEEYTIPLKITKPKKTINNLGEEAFPDLLATFSTRFDGSNYNRNTNIKLAAKKVNGTVILPGEKFSFNTIVGSRTIEAGFKEGTAYIGGKVVPDVGGGVCQVSSTIYNTALLANMQIVERSNHMFTTGYVAASRDATVYYGSLDFVFKNSRKYPIKMVASANGGVCKVSIYGIKEEKEYEVIIQSKITSYINPTTIYKEDPTLEEGKEIVEQTAITGCRSEGYKILKLNGKIVSQTLLSKDTYKSRNKIVRRGTKKTTTTPTKPANENRTNTETSNTTTNEPTTPETTENNTTE